MISIRCYLVSQQERIALFCLCFRYHQSVKLEANRVRWSANIYPFKNERYEIIDRSEILRIANQDSMLSWNRQDLHVVGREGRADIMLQRQREAVGPSRPTQTITETPTPDLPPVSGGTLRLRGHRTDERRVAWTENTVDNEKLGRKSSKICCIYHKPKNFDESSSDESSSSDDSDDTGDEHDDVARRQLAKKRQEKKRQAESDDHTHSHDANAPCNHHQKEQKDKPASHSSRDNSPARNAYEKGVR